MGVRNVVGVQCRIGGGQPTTYIVNDLSKKRSLRIDGLKLPPKLGEDQKKVFTVRDTDFVPKLKGDQNKTRSSRHKFIIAGIAIGGEPGYAYTLIGVYTLKQVQLGGHYQGIHEIL